MRRISRCLVAAALVASGLTIAGTPAQAATISPCNSNTVISGLWMPARDGSVDCYLVYGMWNNPGVSALQASLKYCYQQPVTVDGDFGERTKAALQAVQGRLRIKADGQYGRQTRAAMLFRASANPNVCQKSPA